MEEERKGRKNQNRTRQTMQRKGRGVVKTIGFMSSCHMDVKSVYLNVVSAHTLSYTVTWLLWLQNSRDKERQELPKSSGHFSTGRHITTSALWRYVMTFSHFSWRLFSGAYSSHSNTFTIRGEERWEAKKRKIKVKKDGKVTRTWGRGKTNEKPKKKHKKMEGGELKWNKRREQGCKNKVEKKKWQEIEEN